MSPDDRTFDERLKRIEYKLDVIGGIAITFLTLALAGLIAYILRDQWGGPANLGGVGNGRCLHLLHLLRSTCLLPSGIASHCDAGLFVSQLGGHA